MTELFFNTNALQLNYFESSDAGIPLLLLHGSSSRWQTFLPIIPHLTKFSHVYALDLRGHGKSSRAAQYQLSFFVEDICHFIQDHIKKPTVIFGHSSGGMMAMMTAALHPAWVKALIVGDAPLHLQVLQQLIDSECEIAQRIIAWLRDRKIDQIYATLQNDFRAESLSQ